MRGSLLRTGGLMTALAAITLCSAQPEAQTRDGIGVGGAVALGALGGVAAIASASNGYYPVRPVYVAPPAYEEVCHFERRGFVDGCVPGGGVARR